MGAAEWYIEKESAQTEFDAGRIDREIYERRTRFAIGMIYRCGDSKDRQAAEYMAKAHAYDIEELLKEVM